jgi:hypothetical protein
VRRPFQAPTRCSSVRSDPQAIDNLRGHWGRGRREQIPIPLIFTSGGGVEMIDQLASAMAAVALIAVLLVTALFHIDRIPGPSAGNQPSVQLAVRR